MEHGEKHTGLYTKIENSNQDYIRYSNEGTNAGSFRYYDALEIFRNLCISSRRFNSSNKSTMTGSYIVMRRASTTEGLYTTYEGRFKQRLRDIGVSEAEINNIWQYMMDTMIRSKTVAYPEQNRFVLENIDNLGGGSTIGADYLYKRSRDQSRNVDFGLHLRQNADLWISKDVYKATTLINGKKQEYMYSKKNSETDSNGTWYLNLNRGDYLFKVNADGSGNGGTATSDSSSRAGNEYYIGESSGGHTYSREVRKSDYIYDATDAYGKNADIKNLQVFVTYRIAIKNQAQSIHTSVNELIDYYDKDEYTYRPDLDIVKENTFIGDRNEKKLYDVNISTESIYKNKYGSMDGYYANSNNIRGLNKYDTLFITGIVSGNGQANLRPGEMTYLYITFKVNNDESGKVRLDQDFDEEFRDLVDTTGKKNVIEINGYSTYYGTYNSGRYDYTKAGVIDIDSNPGSLKAKDLDDKGNIISSNNSWENRLEDDTDKASNIKLKVSSKNDDNRIFTGYVFEDERTEVSDAALVGNGRYDEGETKINGVTIELVELVQEVNEQGFPTGNYEREKIWSSVSYRKSGNNWQDSIDPYRYYSGSGKSRVILSGPGLLAVMPTEFGDDAPGRYQFDSFPSGDFFVRFTYGDTTQTVLTNADDEVQKALNQLSGENKEVFVNNRTNAGILGTSGLNSKSYTGQDYKSTIYQVGVDQNAVGEYNGIKGYLNTTVQNYNRDNVNDKGAMYYYNIAESDKNIGISDGKDVYSYRQDEINYSKGSNSSFSGIQTLKNYRGEILTSGYELTTSARAKVASANGNQELLREASEMQRNALEQLVSNTKMIAQTGIINTEMEYNRRVTNGQDTVNKNPYAVQDLDLGLVLRPEAQVLLSKELTNMQVKLANGQTLFDTHQTVNNLYYGSHKIYKDNEFYSKVSNNGSTSYRLRHDITRAVKNRQEELVYATMDEELIHGATITLSYRYTLDNIGEVDYLDTDFYYKGKTNNTSWNNIAKTNANNVIDYVTNEMKFENKYQKDSSIWEIITRSQLVNEANEDNSYINNYYKDVLDTYNVLLKTTKLSGDLIPRAIDTSANKENSRRETTLVLSTLLTGSIETKNLIYNNLVEVIELSNSYGRRTAMSNPGNQPMAYQSENMAEDESTIWMRPTELDADSSQRARVGVPTGENKDYMPVIAIALASLSIIAGAVIIIKTKIFSKHTR